MASSGPHREWYGVGNALAQVPGLGAAHKQIRQLESKLAVARWAVDLLNEPTDPKGGSRLSL